MNHIKQAVRSIMPISLYTGLADMRQEWRREADWRLSWQAWRSVSYLKDMKGKHRGQRCFIIGNGPSLKKMDLSPLRFEVTFGLNRIYLLFPELGFHTTYLVAINRLIIEQCAGELAELDIPKFISWNHRSWIKSTDRPIYIRSANGTLGFSKEPFRQVHAGATVTYAAMQLAFFMGFDQVILIGVDHNFITKGKPHEEVTSKSDDPNHFSPNYFAKGFRWQLPDLKTSEKAYRLARDAFQKDGREIVDATVGGHLRVFRRVSYEELFPSLGDTR